MECINNNTVKRGPANPINDKIVINDHGSGGSTPGVSDNSIVGVTCSAAVTVGDTVYINGSGVAIKAQANAISTSNVVGVVTAKASSTSCTLQTCGYTGSIFSGLTPGATYFLSNSSSGALTTSFPTSSGHAIAPVGKAYSASVLIINIQTRIIRG